MSNVAGEIVVPDRAPTVSGTQVVVRVRDITYSDAPVVQPVAQQNVVADVAPGARIPFSIDVPDDALAKVATREMELNLEVHVDLDGSGNFSPGDLVSLRPHPVGPDSPGAPMRIPLTLV